MVLHSPMIFYSYFYFALEPMLEYERLDDKKKLLNVL